MNADLSLLKKQLKRKKRVSFSALKTTLGIDTDDALMTQILDLLERELKGFSFVTETNRYSFLFSCLYYIEYAPSKLNFKDEYMCNYIHTRLDNLLPIIKDLLKRPIMEVEYNDESSAELLNVITDKIIQYCARPLKSRNKIEESYLYEVMNNLIFQVKNPEHIQDILNKLPYIKNITNKEGKTLLEEVIEYYLVIIQKETDPIELMAFQKIVNLLAKPLNNQYALRLIKKRIISLSNEIKYDESMSNTDKQKIYDRIVQINKNLNCFGIDKPGVDQLIQKYLTDVSFKPYIIDASKTIKPIEYTIPKDYRNRCVITIDDSRCSVREDAFSFEKLPNKQYQLGVYITDIDYFVRPESTLDLEALRRAISPTASYSILYPKEFLVNNISLLEKQDRRVIAFTFIFDDKANILDYQVEEAIINVNKNLDYFSAKHIVEHKSDLKIYNILNGTNNLITIKNLRDKNPNLDHSILENITNKPFKITGIRVVERLANLLNSFTANYFDENKYPFAYSVDKCPDREDLIYSIQCKLGDTAEAKKIINVIKKTPVPTCTSTLNTGFNRLELSSYGDVCNPIRFYPALVNQRLIKAYMINKNYIDQNTKDEQIKISMELSEYYQQNLPIICKAINEKNKIKTYYHEELNDMRPQQKMKIKALTKKL